MVMIARPDSSLRSIEQDAAAAEPRALGCFRRRLAGNAGVNCIHMSPHGDMIITAGSTRTGGQSGSVMGAQEAGWVQMWEEARDSPGWVLLGTLDAGGRRPAGAALQTEMPLPFFVHLLHPSSVIHLSSTNIPRVSSRFLSFPLNDLLRCFPMQSQGPLRRPRTARGYTGPATISQRMWQWESRPTSRENGGS